MKGRTRQSLLWIHMVGGIALALYAIAVGVSGSVLVFRDEMTALRGSRSGGNPDAALEAVREKYPEWRVLSLTWPNRLNGAWMAYLLKGNASREVFVRKGESGMEVVRDRVPGGGRMTWLLRFHANFHSGATGRLINGIAGLALIGMAVSGLLLWYRPRKGGVRWWHHTSGLIAAAFLVAIGITGGYYVWQRQYIAAVDRWFPRATSPALEIAATSEPLSMSELTWRASRVAPGRKIFRASADMTAPVQVTFLEGDELEFHRVTSVVLDPVTGAVLQMNPYQERPTGNSILAWFSVVHFGRFAGFWGRVLWCILGLSLPLLSITGLWMWWRRKLA